MRPPFQCQPLTLPYLPDGPVGADNHRRRTGDNLDHVEDLDEGDAEKEAEVAADGAEEVPRVVLDVLLAAAKVNADLVNP